MLHLIYIYKLINFVLKNIFFFYKNAFLTTHILHFKGRGVFALKTFSPGEKVLEYDGILRSPVKMKDYTYIMEFKLKNNKTMW